MNAQTDPPPMLENRNLVFLLLIALLLTACETSALPTPQQPVPRMAGLFRLVDLSGYDLSLPGGTELPSSDSCGSLIPSGCTVFTISKGDRVFFGGNDDYINPDSYYWVDPGKGEDYGAIWIGPPTNVQQGVNEKGLAYDANGLPSVDTNPHREREPVYGDYTIYPIRILHECATVVEVIEWVEVHQWHPYMHDQMQFADASGDAVIISAGEDGEVVFTRKPQGDGFLVSTNFNVANPSNGYGYPCWRYDTATERLSELLNRETELTAQDATDVLDAVHTEGGSSWTLESMVADLPHGVVYLYTFYQYDQPLVLNVAEEIAKAPPPSMLNKMFPEDVRVESARRYQQAIAKQDLCTQIGKIWAGLVLASLVIIILFARRSLWGWIFWMDIAIVLGPLGLLVWLIAGRKHNLHAWQAALVEAAGYLPPVVVAYMVVLGVLIVFPQAQSNQLLLLLIVFILPVLLGWLFFQGPLLALATRRGYLRTLGQRLPAAWVGANLGMAGVFALATPLVDWLSRTCSLLEPSPWTLASLWAAVIAGAVLGLLLVILYEGWAVRRGFRAWSVLASAEGEVSTPPWRKLWWWILLGFAAMIGGVIANNLLQQIMR
jgi:hypothetical protein